MNVTVALPPGHTLAFPEIATVGGGTTVMITVPVCGWLQPGVPGKAALTNAYVVVDV